MLESVSVCKISLMLPYYFSTFLRNNNILIGLSVSSGCWVVVQMTTLAHQL